MAAKLNLAAHESAFPVLRDLRVENPSTHRIEDLTLTLEASPSFAQAKTWPIDRVEAGGVARIVDRELLLEGGILRSLTESVAGRGAAALGAWQHLACGVRHAH